jgi:DNA-binding CsgD family transcriptional regulator
MSCHEVGRLLGLSRKTVEKHQYRMRDKLEIHGAVELARFAIREGLLSP